MQVVKSSFLKEKDYSPGWLLGASPQTVSQPLLHTQEPPSPWQDILVFSMQCWRTGMTSVIWILKNLETCLLVTVSKRTWGKKVKVIQSCLTLCNPMNCSLPGSSVHGILQARILQWVANPFSRGSSQPMDRTQVSSNAGWFFII